MKKIKKICEEKKIERQHVEELVSFASTIIWKKSQIDLITIWTGVINRYILEQTGYH